MNKIFKSALVALVAVTGLTMASCVNEYEYDAATSEGSKVYFSKDLAETVDVSSDESEFQVPVSRTSTDGELTVPVSVTMSEGSIFTPAASSVTFANGSSTAYLTFTYDPAKVEYGKYDAITVEITDAAQVTTYGLPVYSFKAGKTEWMKMDTSKGKASFRDDLIASLYGLDNYIWEVDIEESVVTKNKFRVVGPYGPTSGFKKTKLFDSEDEWKECYNDAGLNVDMVIDASDPEHVWFSAFDSGITLNSADGEMSFLTFIEYRMKVEGITAKEACAKYPEYCGKLEDGVISFSTPQSCLFTIGGDGYYYANSKGLLSIALPGYAIGDFSVEASFSGIFTDASDMVFAVTEVKLGDDATKVKAVVMSADVDAGAVADAIAAGEIEGVDIVDGANNVPIPEDMSGKLQVIFVVLDGNKVKNVESVPFEYYAGTNPWKSLGVGYYTDDAFWSSFTEEGKSLTYKVEIEENTETPGVYRIKNAYSTFADWWAQQGMSGDGATDIVVNAEDPAGVYILNQPIGLSFDYSGYGAMSIETEGGYYVSKGYPVSTLKTYGLVGTLEDGVITFPVLPREDADGNPITDAEGNQLYYQGWLNFEEGKYFAMGANGEMQLILPNANAAAVAKAKRAAAASDFERRMFAVPSTKSCKKGTRRIMKTLKKANFEFSK